MELLITNIIKFWYTIAVIFILGRFLYYRNNGKKDYLFTFLLLAAVIFLICRLISRVDLSLGFAIGIFAIFGVIRYRTTPISPREMTYIFLSSGIAAKNALISSYDLEVLVILITDFSLILLVALSEYFLFRKKLSSKMIVYDHPELIHPEKRDELYQDLNRRYGISEIQKIKVGKIDSLKNSVRLIVSFKDPGEDHFEDE